jgi:hypothetical protein
MSRQRESTAGSMVTRKYAAPAPSSAPVSPSRPTSTAPSTPPRGIRTKHIAVVSESTRPTSAGGIRSYCTAPRIGLRNPEKNPPTTQVATTTQVGPIAKATNRGRPVTRNATR